MMSFQTTNCPLIQIQIKYFITPTSLPNAASPLVIHYSILQLTYAKFHSLRPLHSLHAPATCDSLRPLHALPKQQTSTRSLCALEALHPTNHLCLTPSTPSPTIASHSIHTITYPNRNIPLHPLHALPPPATGDLIHPHLHLPKHQSSTN